MSIDLNNPKKLGFGGMRFPVREGGAVDTEQLKAMFDRFLAAGFTYFDTAYMYHGGASEPAIREALVSRYPRDAFTIADKMPFSVKEPADVPRIFDEQRQRLGVDYFDYYLLHNVNANSLPQFDACGCWAWLEGLREQGLAKRVGFSFHDTPALLDRVLTEHPFVDFVQLQINYIDWEAENVQSRGVYETARRHGKQVVIMEPVKGGQLASLPAEAEAALKAASPDASPASFAVRYAASLEGVLTVLSGMSDLAQVEDNVSYMADFKPLAAPERDAVAKVVELLNAVPTVPCTRCRYCCDGCPMNIDIPRLITVLNESRRYGMSAGTLGGYRMATRENGAAADCVSCGQCESVCPQHLPIPQLLADLAEAVAAAKQ